MFADLFSYLDRVSESLISRRETCTKIVNIVMCFDSLMILGEMNINES